MKFIQLTFYEFNKSYPEKSKCTNKKFWLDVSDISRFTSYTPKNSNNNKTAPTPSTKITLKSGDIIEVCEDITTIVEKVNK